MTMLTRWNPYREMLTLRDQIDRWFDRPFSALGLASSMWDTMYSNGIPLDVVENDDAFVVKASVPGFSADQLDVTLEKNVLTIKGEMRQEQEREGEQYHLRERSHGRFSRSVYLPGEVEPDAVQADLANGILTLTVPKAEVSRPKRIAIQSGAGHSGNGHKALEGQPVEQTA